jgi:DNA ligase (NAD+)
MTVAEQHADMCARIRAADRAYYRDCAPIMSDYQYDVLVRDLERLESAHPELVTAESPSQRVGH